MILTTAAAKPDNQADNCYESIWGDNGYRSAKERYG